MKHFDSFLRLAVGLALLVCAYAIARRGLAAAYFRNPTPEQIEHAIRLDPGRPQYYTALARVQQYSPSGADLAEIIWLYETAVRLSPRQASYWADLADAYERAGRLPEAERAYERARLAAPSSPEVSWQRGNFLLRRQRTPDALEAFRPVLLAEPKLRRQAFDLAWRATEDAALILEKMIPPQADIGFEYLDYLVEKRRLEAAGQLWLRLFSWNLPFDPRAALPYLDSLRTERRPEELQAAWKELVARFPVALPRLPAPPEALTNGGFETDLFNGGLDWRVEPLESVIVSVDNLTFFEGARSLQLRFDGRHNLDYRHVLQYVPVRPRTRYRFSYFIRTEGLTTDSGLCFQLTDAAEPSRLSLSTLSARGSVRWSLEQAEFTTGPDTRMLSVKLVRPRSERFDNKLAGRAWVDQVRLIALPDREPPDRGLESAAK